MSKREPCFMSITNTQTGRTLTVVEQSDGNYEFIIPYPAEARVELRTVLCEALGEQLKEFMKEKK